ncbi:MAG: helix-hairpin-helix domain-containing protein [Anaerolineae bacterium]
MASALNLLIAGIIGFIVGLVLELVLEIWYFRRWRKQVRDERVEQLQATVRAKDSRIGDLDGRLERAQTRMNALQGEVAQRTQEVERMQAERLARLAAVVSDAEPLETAELEAPTVALPTFEAPAVELGAFEMPTLELPAVALPTFETPAVELGAFETPTLEAPAVEFGAFEMPTLEAPAVELPTFEAPAVELGAFEMPTLELPTFEAPAVEMPAFAMGAVGMAVSGLPTRGPAAITLGDDPLIDIDGIGPAYDQRLRAAGITTFAGLAALSVEQVAAIIKAPAWRKTNYADWLRQARLAAEQGAAALQAQPSLRALQPDNLALLAQVGEKTADALAAAGFYSFAGLAAATPAELAAAVEDAGLPAGNYAAWIQEAAERSTGADGRRRSVKPLE